MAIELCPATLYDVIERPLSYPFLTPFLCKAKVLYEIVEGLRHIHALKLVHRDIKPQNVLISTPRYGRKRIADILANPETNLKTYSPKALLSDFGLGKRLESEKNSLDNSSPEVAANSGGFLNGTIGWRAPEYLVSYAVANDPVTGTPRMTQITCASDIFAAGFTFYFLVD